MKKILLITVISVLFNSFLVAEDGWTDLIKGKNLDGWVRYDGTATFKYEQGEIIGISETGTPNSFLATRKNYGDFILEYEMYMDRGLNSGVQIRSRALQPDGTHRVNGYQVEYDDHADRPWVGGIYEEAGRGWLYPMTYNPEAYAVFRPGEWNRIRVEAIGPVIRTYVNGVPFANLVDDKRPEGFIALQVHAIGDDKALEGKEIRWRNIRILMEGLEAARMRPDAPAPEVSYLDNELTENQMREGWKLLWDGKTTEGWRGARLDHFPEKGWVIKDGVLTVKASGGEESGAGGDIVTTRLYKNFILEVDFLVTKGANSGIKYFVDTELNKGEGSAIGCEYQILDDENHPDAKLGVEGNRTLASLYDLIPANALLFHQDNTRKRFNGIGSWNRARIEVRGSHVCHYLNGVKVVEYERGTQMWKALVAYSKYSVWPAFGEAEEGNILLQEHGTDVSFKNIKILEL